MCTIFSVSWFNLNKKGSFDCAVIARIGDIDGELWTAEYFELGCDL